MKSLHQEKRPNFPLNAVGVTASNASRHLFGFLCLCDACRFARPSSTDPRGRKASALRLIALANECP